mmetsp:Transcript_44880/g.54356  ORF Transcript_44880/g.54356 Transcript_44880/m.54356 type:complete len:90 (-) Transcript_44880:33-302(-)
MYVPSKYHATCGVFHWIVYYKEMIYKRCVRWGEVQCFIVSFIDRLRALEEMNNGGDRRWDQVLLWGRDLVIRKKAFAGILFILTFAIDL